MDRIDRKKDELILVLTGIALIISGAYYLKGSTYSGLSDGMYGLGFIGIIMGMPLLFVGFLSGFRTKLLSLPSFRARVISGIKVFVSSSVVMGAGIVTDTHFFTLIGSTFLTAWAIVIVWGLAWEITVRGVPGLLADAILSGAKRIALGLQNAWQRMTSDFDRLFRRS